MSSTTSSRVQTLATKSAMRKIVEGARVVNSLIPMMDMKDLSDSQALAVYGLLTNAKNLEAILIPAKPKTPKVADLFAGTISCLGPHPEGISQASWLANRQAHADQALLVCGGP